MPVMAQHVTAAERNAIVVHRLIGVNLDDLSLAFGILMDEGDRELVDAAISRQPEGGTSGDRRTAGARIRRAFTAGPRYADLRPQHRPVTTGVRR